MDLAVPKLQLVWVLPYTSKLSLDLRAQLRKTYKFVSLRLGLGLLADLVNYFDPKIPWEKNPV